MKKLKQILFLPMLSLLILMGPGKSDVLAAPANPEPLKFTQPDGEELTLRRGGDENFHFTVTEEGYLVYMADDGFYHFVLSDGEDGVMEGETAFNGEAFNALKSVDLKTEGQKKAYARLKGYSYGGKRDVQGERVTYSRLLNNQGGRAEIGSSTGADTEMPVVTIVVSFNNIGYDYSYSWNKELYAEKSNLTDYYKAMSNGKFTFVPAEESCKLTTDTNAGFDNENDGIIHVKIDMDHGDWSNVNPNDEDTEGQRKINCMTIAMKKAVKEADKYIDFKAFDNNDDGKIGNDELAITFVFAGYEASSEADIDALKKDNDESVNYLVWSHKGYLSGWYDVDLPDFPDAKEGPAETEEGVTVDQYVVIAEHIRDYKEDNTFTITAGKVGVYFHELGHYLGLPDLYDSSYLENGPWLAYDSKELSLMNGGGWAKDSDGNYCPTALDAWSRFFLEWTEPEEITKNGSFTVNSQGSDSGYSCFSIGTDNPGEYYLIENRRAEGIDAGLCSYYDKENAYSDNGIVIWHIDNKMYDRYEGENKVNTINHRPAVVPLFYEFDKNNYWSLAFNSTSANNLYAFYSKTAFESCFSESDGYNEGLNLPLYGKTNNAENPAEDPANDPDKRTLSGIHLYFTGDPGKEMNFEVEIDKNKPLSGMLTDKEAEMLADPLVCSLSKNNILLKVDERIDARVTGNSNISFDQALKGVKKDTKEYWVSMDISSALRYDGRKHDLKSGSKSKKKNPDLRLSLFYCEKTGDFEKEAPSADKTGKNGTDGWTEAEISKVKLANMKGATIDLFGKCNVKGYKKSTYLTGITLKDPALNKTLGKAVNNKLKELSRLLKSDKTTEYTDADLDKSDAAPELQLIIPVYPLYIGDVYSYGDEKTYMIKNGDDTFTQYGPNFGTFDPAKKKLIKASVRMSYDGSSKDLKLTYSSKKDKDFKKEVNELKNFEGKDAWQLEARGNYFGFVDFIK